MILIIKINSYMIKYVYYIMFEWSYGKNRTVSVLERLLEPPKPKKWYEHFICFRKKHQKSDLSMSYS